MLQFDNDSEGGEMEVIVADKGVLLYNQALIHLRVISDVIIIAIKYFIIDFVAPSKYSSSWNTRTTL